MALQSLLNSMIYSTPEKSQDSLSIIQNIKDIDEFCQNSSQPLSYFGCQFLFHEFSQLKQDQFFMKEDKQEENLAVPNKKIFEITPFSKVSKQFADNLLIPSTLKIQCPQYNLANKNSAKKKLDFNQKFMRKKFKVLIPSESCKYYFVKITVQWMSPFYYKGKNVLCVPFKNIKDLTQNSLSKALLKKIGVREATNFIERLSEQDIVDGNIYELKPENWIQFERIIFIKVAQSRLKDYAQAVYRDGLFTMLQRSSHESFRDIVITEFPGHLARLNETLFAVLFNFIKNVGRTSIKNIFIVSTNKKYYLACSEALREISQEYLQHL